MRLDLPPHVHVCISDGRAVFLDTKADRYSAVPLSASFAGILSGAAPADDRDAQCRRLAQARLLVPKSEQTRPVLPASIVVPQRSILETGRPRGPLSFRVAGRMACAMARARHSLGHIRLDRLLGSLEEQSRAANLLTDPKRLILLALRFADHRALIPSKRICLADSLALLFFLHRHGCSADLVFGVQAAPFYAHCWVQSGQWILNDSGYFPASLAPLLRVRG